MKSLQARYLDRLAELYPTIAAASTEIINLESILNLPKGTEHFLTDIHGEYEAFSHVLKNGSGSVKRKIDDVFGNTLSRQDKQSLATLIYYPAEKMSRILQTEKNPDDWYKITLYRLIAVCRRAASKYTRSKIRKALPKEFAYVLEELLTERGDLQDKESYYDAIVQTIVRVGRAKAFIIALSELIQRLTVDHLHIVGDIYDRGPGPHIIMDKMMTYHSIDVQWGNHDVLWMGAAAGQMGCIANAIRICARYGNLDILEDGYGINLLPLATFAINTYGDDPCTCFQLKGSDSYSASEREMNQKMHKAISIIQFKAEGQIIKRHPEYGMEERILLSAIRYDRGTVTIDGKEYPMRDMNFPTVDPADPLRLTDEEEELLHTLELSFRHNARLHEHVRFLYSNGSMYKCCNSNLLYHGCIPMTENREFDGLMVGGKMYRGKELMDFIDTQVKNAYFLPEDAPEKEACRDFMWYLWNGAKSPVFGKDKNRSFEHYFIEDPEVMRETMNPYYQLSEEEETCDMILKEFGLPTKGSHIINGHMPVKIKSGETPIRAGGKLFIIDGGLSKAYQERTGIAGYTLIFNSHHLALAEHKPFDPERERTPKVYIVEKMQKRITVADTDEGKELAGRIEDLKELLKAYRSGLLKERVR